MRAWIVKTPGDEDALELETIDAPQPGPQQVLVDVRAIGVNRADILQRQGAYPPPAGYDARRPGLEYAGRIVAAGEHVYARQVGDAVMGLIGGGAYAESIVAHERETIAMPAHYDFADAAAVPEAFLTAYRALFLVGGLAPGQWALVRGATSGVGLAALQLVAALGARSIATSRSRARLDEIQSRCKALGLEHAYDRAVVAGEAGEAGEAGVAERVQEFAGGAHVVVDFVGAPVLADNLAALRDEGLQVQVGVMGGANAKLDMGVLLMRRLGLRAMTMRSLPLERRIEMAQLFENRLRPLFEAGRLKPMVDARFDFADAGAAHRAMEAGGHLGKLVLVRG